MRTKFTDFSGGLTDYIFNSGETYSAECNNLLITKDKKLLTRNGFGFYSSGNEQIPSGSYRVNKIFPMSEQLFFHSVNELMYIQGGSFNYLRGPTGLPALNRCSSTDFISVANVNQHYIITDSVFSNPIKVYNEGANTFRLRTAGLPALASNPSTMPVTGQYITAYNATTKEVTFNTDHNLAGTETLAFYSNTGTSRGSDTIDSVSATDKVILTTGISSIVATDLCKNTSATYSKSYLYKLVYSYSYSIEGVTWEDVSTPVQIAMTDGSDFTNDNNVIYNIPELTGLHYDATNIKIKIYRTTDTGINFHYVDEITNGTTTYQDTTTDTDLVANEQIYTDSGELENDAPPLCKFVTSANNCIWYANILSGAEKLPYRVMQSKPNDIDSVPVDNYVDVDEEIMGISSINNYPIVFTKNKVYRIEGFFDALGRGSLSPRLIYDRTGCIGNNSIVKTSNLVYFAGEKGWFVTDGFTVKSISEQLPETYKSLVLSSSAKINMAGAYDKVNGRVYWSCQKGPECDTIFVFDENHSAFTTINSELNLYPTALEFEDGTLVCGCKQGYLFKFDDSFYDDLDIDTSSAVADWVKQPIQYKWKHIPFDAGAPNINKWWNKVSVFAKNESDLNLQASTIDDLEPTVRDLKEITYHNDLVWESSSWEWEDPDTIWDEQEVIVSTRWMVAGKIRSKLKQLQLTNKLAYVDYSDISQVATIDTTPPNNSATMAVNHFYDNIIGMQFRYKTSSGAYSPYYIITDKPSDSVIYFNGPNTSVVTSNTGWDILGYPMSQRLHLIAIEYQYEVISDKGGYYQQGQEGGNE